MSRRRLTWRFAWAWCIGVVLTGAALAQPPTNPGIRWDDFDPATLPLQSTDRILVAQGAQGSMPNPYLANLSAVIDAVVFNFLCREADSVPTIFNCKTFTFDQADGFTLTNPGAGEVRIDWQIPSLDFGDFTCAAGVCTVDGGIGGDFVEDAGDTMTGNLEMDDGAGASPKVIFDPSTAAAFELYATADTYPHLLIAASPASGDTKVTFDNLGAGNMIVAVDGRIDVSEFINVGTLGGGQTSYFINPVSFQDPITVTGQAVCLEDGTDCPVGGGGTPGGADTQVQYNDGGVFGGDAGFTFNETTDTLTVAADVVVGSSSVCLFNGTNCPDWLTGDVTWHQWDISTYSHLATYNVNAQEAAARALWLSPDGLHLYVVGNAGDDVNEYALSTAWNIATATFVRTCCAGLDTDPFGIAFNDAGTKMFTYGIGSDTVREYTLSTPWNISTAAFVQASSSTAAACPFAGGGMWVNGNASLLYLQCGGTSGIVKYTLSTPGNVSTMTLAEQAVPPSSPATGIAWKLDGTEFFSTTNGGSEPVYAYAVASPWSIVGATLIASFNRGTAPNTCDSAADLKMRPDGTTLFSVCEPGISNDVKSAAIGYVVDGNVGIGTVAPLRDLHVKDTFRLEGRATAPTLPALGDLYTDSTTNKLAFHDGTTWHYIGNNAVVEADLKVVDTPADEECLSYETGGGGDFEWQTCGGGGGAVPAKDWYFSAAALLPLEHGADSIPPLPKTSGTNVDALTRSFDDTVDECVGQEFPVPAGATGTVTFTTWTYSATATSGNFIIEVRHSGGQAEGASWDTALTTVAAAADAVQGTVNLETVTTWTATLSSMAWVAGDLVAFELCRDGNAGGDTLVGDLQLKGLQVSIPR